MYVPMMLKWQVMPWLSLLVSLLLSIPLQECKQIQIWPGMTCPMPWSNFVEKEWSSVWLCIMAECKNIAKICLVRILWAPGVVMKQGYVHTTVSKQSRSKTPFISLDNYLKGMLVTFNIHLLNVKIHLPLAKIALTVSNTTVFQCFA